MKLGLTLALFCTIALFCMVSGQDAFAEIKYQFEFGSTGRGNADLNDPTDVVYDASNRLLHVVDSDNHRINVFERDGDPNSRFGTYCSVFSIRNCDDDSRGAVEDGDGQFDGPTAATFDRRGDLFVVDSDNRRIQKFDGTTFETKFGSTDINDADYLGSPQGIAVFDSAKLIYVSSRTSDAIHVFDYSGKFLFKFDSLDRGESFRDPSHLLIDNTRDILYVSDTGNDRLAIFKLVDSNICPSDTIKVGDGVCFVEKFGKSGSGNGKFDGPTGLALDFASGILYVSDTGNDRIQALSLRAKSSGILDAPTNLNAEPTSPTSIIVSWDAPRYYDGISKITGYKIEYKEGSEKYNLLDANADRDVTIFVHTGLDSSAKYTYRISAVNSEGSGSPTYVTESPSETTTPSGVVAHAISPSQVRLSWNAPSNTFGQQITGYDIQRIFSNGSHDMLGSTNARTNTFVVSNLSTDKTYSFAVSATFGFSSSNISKTVSATPREDSTDTQHTVNLYAKMTGKVPDAPTKLSAIGTSSQQINLSWQAPTDEGDSKITGYKLEYKKDAGPFVTLKNLHQTSNTYHHMGLSVDSQYTYQIYAINSEGSSKASNQVTASPLSDTLKLNPIGRLQVDEGKQVSFSVRLSKGTVDNVLYSLESGPPHGATIQPVTGLFSWIPDNSQGGKSYTFDIVAKKGAVADRQTVVITVNEMRDQRYTDNTSSQVAPTDGRVLTIPAPFVDTLVDPQHYIDRYNNEPVYKEWFDTNYSEYSSIYEAVGVQAPQSTVSDDVADREFGECGPNTELRDGICQVIDNSQAGGGCLVATAAFGSELAPQVQFLREVRDNTVMSTSSGSVFMSGFNQIYYLFSPYVADYQRENPLFKDIISLVIAPLIASLGLMSLAETENEVLTYGIVVILVNIGMYIIAPIAIAYNIIRLHRNKNRALVCDRSLAI